MAVSMQALGIDRLSIEDRLTLVHEIWDSVAAGTPRPMLSDAQRQELDRRIAEDDANPDDLVAWEEVKAQALARIK